MAPLGRDSLNPKKTETPPAREVNQPVDEPRNDRPEDGTYHDSLSGRAVDHNGVFVDGRGDGPVPPHRIVSDTWPQDRPKIDTEAGAEEAKEHGGI